MVMHFTTRHLRPNLVLKKFQSVFTLNKVLPDLCEAAGVKRKTAHCLRVTCASSLFNAGVEEKLIRERTGHRSNALLKYEKPSEENKGKLSYLLGPNAVLSSFKRETCKQEDGKPLTSSFMLRFTRELSKIVISTL